MQAQNTAHAAALGYGLGVARAVGRNVATLRAARTGPVTVEGGAKDVRTLESAGLVEVLTWGRSSFSFSLTDAGRTLAGKL